jgi:hypothetical protein
LLNIQSNWFIEDPCSNLQGIFDRKEGYHFQIRSLSPQPAKHCRQAEPAGNALAFSVQGLQALKSDQRCGDFQGFVREHQHDS